MESDVQNHLLHCYQGVQEHPNSVVNCILGGDWWFMILGFFYLYYRENDVNFDEDYFHMA